MINTSERGGVTKEGEGGGEGGLRRQKADLCIISVLAYKNNVSLTFCTAKGRYRMQI